MKKFEFVVLRNGIEDCICETMQEALNFVQAVLEAYPRLQVEEFKVVVIINEGGKN